jgi:hypothetical protein
MNINKFNDVCIYQGDKGWQCVRKSSFYHDGRIPVDMVETPGIEILKTLRFNESTKWTDSTLPRELMEYGKTPPFGIKDIHAQGITGKGINVAIIDQPLALDHPEYKGKIAAYETFGLTEENSPSSMHGPAVASLLVGNTIGVAPGAKVYYAAAPSWLRDTQYESAALDWIVGRNESLPEKEKIKLVSVSAAPNSPNVRDKNRELWDISVEKAIKAGMVVLDCTRNNRFISPGYVEYGTDIFKYGFPKKPEPAAYDDMHQLQVHVPNSLRTVAESYDNEKFSYAYCGQGGLSWGIPYAAGVLCLGQQVNSKLTAEELKELLVETASKNKNIIAPKEFLAAIKSR